MSEKAIIAAPETKPKSRKKKPERELIVVRDGRKVRECNLCEKLCESRTQIVNGYGPKHARIAFIAEAPGEVEDDRGRPLIGPAGVTARNWLVKVGLNPERDVYFDNAVKCRPEDNRTPSAKEIRNCNEHLFAALEEIQPDIIVAAGNSAIDALLPAAVAAEGITKVRGHVFWNEQLRRKIIPMFHPSAAFHDFGVEIFCLADLRKAVKEAKHPTQMPPGLGDYKTLLTVEEVEAECERLEKSDLLCFDTETTHPVNVECSVAGDKGGLDWRTAQILCVGLTDEVGKAWVVPLYGKNFRQIWNPSEYKRVIKALMRLLASDVPKVAQNGKFDIHMLREHGITVNAFFFDTMLAYSFIHESASHALEPMRSMFTTMPFYDTIVYEQTDGKKHMEWAEEADLHIYCGADVDCTLRIAKELDKLLDEEGDAVRWVFENVSMPGQAVASEIERHGVLIDMGLADHIIEETDRLIATTEVAFFSALPEQYHDVSLTSPPQLKRLLYVDLKLPMPPVLTDKGAVCKVCRDRENQHWFHTSTNKDAIKELEDVHPCVKPLQTITQLHTLKKTFLLGEEGKRSGLLHHVGSDGRIHTAYRCDGAESGRWSSSPNLQNIPKEKDERPEVYQLIRKLFIAPPGRKLVEVDSSQIELRILAYIAGETEMIEKFERGDDFHLFTARHLLYKDTDPHLSDKEWRDVHEDKRGNAKVFNFGVPYGLTPWGIAQRFHVAEERAVDMINEFMGYFTHVRDYFRKSDRDLKRRAKRLNALGRARHFFGIKTMTHFGGYKRMLGHMKREAYNYPIQSTAADVLTLSLIAINEDPWFEDHDSFIVLTVHDSVTIECPEEYAEAVARRVQKIFAATGREYLAWYLPAEAKCGQRWTDWDWTIDANGVLEQAKKAA